MSSLGRQPDLRLLGEASIRLIERAASDLVAAVPMLERAQHGVGGRSCLTGEQIERAMAARDRLLKLAIPDLADTGRVRRQQGGKVA